MLQVFISMEESQSFHVAGELLSMIDFMPFSDYQLTYILVPLEHGVLDLPLFSISKYGTNRKVSEDKQLFLLRGYTQ